MHEAMHEDPPEQESRELMLLEGCLRLAADALL